MERKEAVEIIKAIETFYPGKFRVDDPKALLDAWHKVLIDYEFESIMANLQSYVKTNRFAPSVADIINVEAAKDRAIPTHEETKALIASWDKALEGKASKDQAAAALAEMRKALGINRG